MKDAIAKPTLARIKRIQAAERKQQGNTRDMNIDREFAGLPLLVVEKVCVKTLLETQNYCCENCGAALDFDSKWDAAAPPPLYPVVAHKFHRGSGGDHAKGNVFIWCWTCNSLANPLETSQSATQKKFGVIQDDSPRQKPTEPKAKSRWSSDFVPTPPKDINA